MESAKTEAVIHIFEKTMNKYIATEKKPCDYGVGCLLHRSEIHTIDAIGRNPQINITDLSNYLGVTKSAISQMVDKLIKKDMLHKTVLSKSDTEVALSLTDKGKQVYKGHTEYHLHFRNDIDQILRTIPDESIETFCEIMNKLNAILSED